MQALQLGEFRSIETVDPTLLTIYPDRVALTTGAEARIVPVADLARVKVRTIFGISSLLLKTGEGRTVVADLLEPSDAQAAKALIDELIAGTPVPTEAVA